MPARQKTEPRPAFLPHPPAGRKPKPRRISKKSVSVLRILLPQNCFAKPSPHLYFCTPHHFKNIVVVCRAFSRTSASAEALCFAQRRASATDARLVSIRIVLVKSSDFVQETQPSFRIRFFAKIRSVAKRRDWSFRQNSPRVFEIQKKRAGREAGVYDEYIIQNFVLRANLEANNYQYLT